MKLLHKFLFHRATLVALAIIIQLAIMISLVISFTDFVGFYYGGSLILSMIVVIWIVNQNTNPAYKLAWIIPILLFPVFGVLFYLFFGGNRVSTRRKKRMAYIEEKTRVAMEPQFETAEAIREESTHAATQSQYIEKYSYAPPYQDTYSQYLASGEEKFKRLKEELRKAERFIFLEYFIIEEGIMWNSILEILEEKAQQGVDVRLIYDDFGCLLKLPYKYYLTLEKKGIKCAVFNPMMPVPNPRLHNRDHRKIAVIDGHTGFTGGINLADEYINEIERFGHWKDTAIMIKGEAAWSLTVMFLTMWDYIEGIDEDFDRFKADPLSKIDYGNCGFVQPFSDDPIDEEPVAETVYLNLIYKAKDYIYITTPYLIIGNEVITALTTAAKGGVDVRIITPHIADKVLVHEVTRSNYKILVESGVKIYEYTPGFIHSKTLVSDDEYGVVGTINMDYRSLYLHFECAIWLYHCPSILEIKEDFVDTLKVCKQITIQETNSVPFLRALLGGVLRVFSPLL